MKPEADAVGEAWDVPVFVIAAEHARRYGKRLARLHPDRAELRAYFEEFNAETRPEAGRMIAEWLEIVRRSVEKAGEGRVVVIPVED